LSFKISILVYVVKSTVQIVLRLLVASLCCCSHWQS